MKKIILSFCFTISLLFFYACQEKQEDILPKIDKITIGSQRLENGEILTVYADVAPQVGYQNIYIDLIKEGKIIKDKILKISPVMDMGAMKHGAPHGAVSYITTQAIYQSYVVFTMPTGETESWKLEVEIDQQKITIPIQVKNPPAGNSLVKTFTGLDGNKYIIALAEPTKPKIGINDLDLLIFKRESMYDFPVVDQLSIDFHPEMVSMNHGSSNNISPQTQGNGKYRGKVNYSMTGEWRLFFTLTKETTILAKEIYLDQML